MDRKTYFIRRLLLVIPTFIGITFSCFVLLQFIPGGPVEMAILSMRGGLGSGEGGRFSESWGGVSEEQRKAINAHYGSDKPLGVRLYRWYVKDRLGLAAESYKFSEKTAWQLIKERFPVSLIFGFTGFFLSYLVCIPLGVAKALRNGKPFDFVSSVIVFIGYAVPPFAFGMVLKMLFAGTVDGFWDIFPAAGFHGMGYETLSWWGKAKDTANHMFLPVLCYVIGDFAVLTILMKNSLLDEIGKDYVRTVLAKGGSMKRAVWRHAFRASLVPIATGFGSILSLMFAGSVLIQQVFEIPGMGRLSLEAIVGRDYPLFMAILSVTSILGLLGNVLSDFCYVLIDPRISFQK